MEKEGGNEDLIWRDDEKNKPIDYYIGIKSCSRNYKFGYHDINRPNNFMFRLFAQVKILL